MRNGAQALSILLVCLLAALAGCKKTDDTPSESLGPLSTLYFFPRTGAVGATLTLVGNNFSATAANNIVSFSHAEARAFYARKGQYFDTLKVLVPPGAATGPLTVKVYAQSVTTPNPFTLAPGRWTRKADFPGGPGMYGTGFTIANRTYVLKPGTNEMWAYDPARNAWDKRAACPVGNVALSSRSGELLSFVIGNQGYVGVYLYQYPVDEVRFFHYDPATDQWDRAGAVGRIDAHHAAVFGLGDKGYLVDLDPYTKGVWEYQPATNSWFRKSDFPGVGRYASTSFSIGTKAYLGGGNTGTSGTLLQDLWEYSAPTDTWTRKADLPGTSYEPNGFTASGQGFMVTDSNEIYGYNPSTNVWARQADFPGQSFSGKVSVTADSRGYLVCGRGGGNDVYAEVWEFAPN